MVAEDMTECGQEAVVALRGFSAQGGLYLVPGNHEM